LKHFEENLNRLLDNFPEKVFLAKSNFTSDDFMDKIITNMYNKNLKTKQLC